MVGECCLWQMQAMAQSNSSEALYIPPYAGVRLVEYREHFQLVPVPKMKTLFGYGKIKASKVLCDPEDPNSEPFWPDLNPDDEVWAVMQWYEFEDGHQEQGSIQFIRPDCLEDEVRKKMIFLQEFESMSREELISLSKCFDATEEDLAYIDDKCPNYQTEPDPKATDDYDVYHARLKVMSELQPKTVELLKQANATRDSEQRTNFEKQAVQSYFAELAHYLTEDQVLAWQKTNPVGTGWMCEFGNVLHEPRRTIDRVNHELALNWLRARYNELTAKQLSESIFKRVLRWLKPAAIKKRRERLGLTTKRKPGSPAQ